MSKVKQKKEYITRRGYSVGDVVNSLLTALNEENTVSSGKLLHYTADIITSGGIIMWKKCCWEYAFENINISNPLIFPYLLKNFNQLDIYWKSMIVDDFYRNKEIQEKCAEISLVVQNSLKKKIIKIPSISQENLTKEWLHKSIKSRPVHLVVRKVWNRATDSEECLYGMNEVVGLCMEGNIERALFWVKWLMDMDILTKKNGRGLTANERGPATFPKKQRTMIGFYIVAVFAELYKDIALKGSIKMNEEFQALLDIYRSYDPYISTKLRTRCLIIMTQILTEVPKWKIPKSPNLIQSPETLYKMVSCSEGFFQEILNFPPLDIIFPTTIQRSQKGAPVCIKTESQKKTKLLQDKLTATDDLISNFYES